MNNRLRIAILLTGMLAGFLAALTSCTTAKIKSTQRTTRDSVSTAVIDSVSSKITKDTTTHTGKTNVTTSSDETYTKVTVDSPVVIYVRDTAYRDRVVTVTEKGRKIINTVYVDSFAKERRRLIEENAALKKRNDVAVASTSVVKEKEKKTGWPWYSYVIVAFALFGLVYPVYERYKKAA